MSRYNQTGGNTEPMPFMRKWGKSGEMDAPPPPPPPPIPQQQQMPMVVKMEPHFVGAGEMGGSGGEAGRYGDEEESGGKCREKGCLKFLILKKFEWFN